MKRRSFEVLIRAHEPWDAVEARHRRALLDLLAAAAAPGAPFEPWDRAHFDPGHVTASAVVLAPDAAAMLMIFHRTLGRWLQPGGHVEPGDADTCATALREVFEETGQDRLTPLVPGPLDVDVHRIPASRGRPAHLHHDVRYAFRAAHERLTAGSDVKEARWVPLAELVGGAHDASIRRIAQKLTLLARLHPPATPVAPY